MNTGGINLDNKYFHNPVRIIPYLRFVWATLILVNYIIQASSDFDEARGIEIFLIMVVGLILLTFSLYCVLIGIQEIKKHQMLEAKFFEFFGLFFEFLIFLGGLYLIRMLFNQNSEYWRIGLMLVWQAVLVVFLYVDFKRIRTQ